MSEVHSLAYLQDNSSFSDSRKLSEVDPESLQGMSVTDYQTWLQSELQAYQTKHPKQTLSPDARANVVTFSVDPKTETLSPDGKLTEKVSGKLLADPGQDFDELSERNFSAPVQAILSPKQTTYIIRQTPQSFDVLLEKENPTKEDLQQIKDQEKVLQTYEPENPAELKTQTLPTRLATLDNEGHVIPRDFVHWDDQVDKASNTRSRDSANKPKLPRRLAEKGAQTIKTALHHTPGFAVEVTTKQKHKVFFKFVPHDSKQDHINCFEISPKGVTLKQEIRKGTDLKQTGHQFITDTVGKNTSIREIPLLSVEQIQQAQKLKGVLRSHAKEQIQTHTSSKRNKPTGPGGDSDR